MKVNVPEGVSFVFDARGVQYEIDARRQVEVDPLHRPGLQFVYQEKTGAISNIVRDEQERIASYVEDGVKFDLYYDADGNMVKIVGGGVVKNLRYQEGNLSSVMVG